MEMDMKSDVSAVSLKRYIESSRGFAAILRGPQHEIALANSAFMQKAGNQEIIGKKWMDVFPQAFASGFLSRLNYVYQTKEPYISKGLRVVLSRSPEKKPKESFVDITLQPLLDSNGAIVGVFVQGNDVTKKRHANQHLPIMSQRWQTALEAINDSIWKWDLHSNQVSCCQLWKEQLAYIDLEAGETTAETFEEWLDRLHSDDRQRTVAALRDCLDGRTLTFVSEYRIHYKQDSPDHWITVLARGMVAARDTDGRPVRMTGTYTDISPIKQLADELQQSHELLKNLSDQVPGVLFQFRRFPNGHICVPFASKGLFEYYGVHLEEAKKNGNAAFKYVHPNDLPSLIASIDESARTLKPWHHEFRMLLPDKGLRWYSGSSKPERLPDGSILWHGFVTDNTERKAEEEKTARLALLAQKITTSVVITDALGITEWVNPAFTTMTCYSENEIIGRTPGSVLRGPDTDPAVSKYMRECIEDQIGFDVEVLNYKKSGQPFWQNIKADPIFDENGKLRHFMAVQTDISEKKKWDDLVWRQANYDVLTSLPNRRLFRDRLEQEMKKAHRDEVSMALLFIDLDHFKEANDLLGHDKGDLLLTEAAHRIVNCVRESDTVARLGGDEFTVILSMINDADHVEFITQKILDALMLPFMVDAETVLLSASIGITLYPADANNANDLIKQADQAMYAAKSGGRNQFRYFTSEMQERALERFRLSMDLREALRLHQLSVHFQPVVNLATGHIVKAEALLRWNHPKRGLIEPKIFIPIAEENGTIHAIGDWVFEQAAVWSKKWGAMNNGVFQISVNKSPVQFSKQSNTEAWQKTLIEMGIPLSSVSIEITEGLLLKSSAMVEGRLLFYRDQGIQVALDDFGTGYSSMAYLKRFDIDYLKIDQSFVRDIATNEESRTIAETIIMMAHKLDIQVIAEGIEQEEQRALLCQAGCDFGQGFLFSQAVPPVDFERLLQSH
jgi:diguanylate cyclase (GGDEF)-like protein/PAS domain S-box-containing protein